MEGYPGAEHPWTKSAGLGSSATGDLAVKRIAQQRSCCASTRLRSFNLETHA